MRQRCTLYRSKAGIKPNNLPQMESKSVNWLWRYLLSSKISPAWYLIHSAQKTAISSVLMRPERILYHCVAGVKPNNLLQPDSGLEQWLWRDLPSSSGITTVSIKTTLTSVSDFLNLDATETFFIPLRSWRRAQQSPAIRFRIKAVVVEESSIKFWDCQYLTPFSPVTSWIIPLGMNLIPLDSWHRAQEPTGVRFRIDCLAVVECCSCGLGVWMLSLVMKRVSHHVQFEAKCWETTSHYARLESVMAITHFQTGVSWYFCSFKADVLKIELWVLVWLGVFRANLRLRVWWLSHQAPPLTMFSLPRNTPCSHPG